MKRAVVVILSYSVLAFAFCLGLSAFMGNTQSILEDYRQSYVFCRGFLYFFRILPSVLASGFLVSLAVYFGEDAQKAQMRFSPVIMKNFRATMLLSLVLVAVMTGVAEIGVPLVQRKKTFSEQAAGLLAEYSLLGEQALSSENYSLAHRYGSRILKINPSSPDGKKLIDKSEAVLKAIKKIQPEKPSAKTARELHLNDEISGETVTSLIQKSREAAEKGRWFESHYFAQLASTAGSDRDINIKEARRLASQAWNVLQTVSPAEKTSDQRLFAKKRSAYKALSEGDCIEAYYQFMEISRQDIEWASDPDVTEFLEIARSRVEKQCFFIDETYSLQSFENYLNVYFTVKRPTGYTDVVYIRGITPVYDSGGMVQYLRGLTITTFARNGSFVRSVSVPYAKMLSVAADSFDENMRTQLSLPKNAERVPYILLKSLDRNGRGNAILPKYEYAEPPRSKNAGEPTFAVLGMSTEDFFVACEHSPGMESISLNTLLKSAGKADSFGWSKEVTGAAMIKRITYPLIMCALLLFIASLAWNFRLQKGQIFKFVWVFVIPVCTLATEAFIQIILAVGGLFNFMFISVAGNSALLLAVGIWTVILFLTSFYFVTRKNT